MTPLVALLLGLGLAGQVGNVFAPTRASSDYDRFTKACFEFYQRYDLRRRGILPSPSPAASPSPTPSASPSP